MVFFALNKQEKLKKTERSLQTYPFKLEKCWKNNMSDYLEIAKIVPLETTKKSLLGRIYQVHVNNEEILVWDQSKYSEDLEKFKSDYPKQAAIIEAAIAKINIADNPLLVFAKIK